MYSRAKRLYNRFLDKGNMDNLNRAILLMDEVVEGPPSIEEPDHNPFIPTRRETTRDFAERLRFMAEILHRRSNETGSREDLDRAITLALRSLELTPQSPPPTLLSTLGYAYITRNLMTGSTNDIDRAVMAFQEAVDLMSDPGPNTLCGLGIAFLNRFETTGSADTLEKAIKAFQSGAEAGKGKVERETYRSIAVNLGYLGSALNYRFQMNGERNDLDRAIAVLEKALAIPPDPLSVGLILNILHYTWLARYKLTNARTDLDRAVEMVNSSISRTSENHPVKGYLFNNLGHALWLQFQVTESMSDFNCAVAWNERAAAFTTTPCYVRISSAYFAACLLLTKDSRVEHDQNHPFRARTLLRDAIEMLARTNPRFLQHCDSLSNISHGAGIARLAASTAVECGDEPVVALQLLELGRGVFASSQFEIRSDISVLKTSHPDLAQEFEDIRDRLDQPQNEKTYSNHSYVNPHYEDRRSLSQQFDNLLNSIRRLSGFDRFLLGPSRSDLIGLTDLGPIIVLNVSDYGGQAFIVANHDVQLLPLPLLTVNDLETYADMFLTAVNSLQKRQEYLNARTSVIKVLEWLWDSAVGPVLDRLGFTETPGENSVWPRVWWIGSYWLNVLPIHAAGYYNTAISPPRSAIDRVISSYTPTIKALAYARERRARTNGSEIRKALLVGMPKTPEYSSLPGVKHELKQVQQCLQPHIQTTVTYDCTREEILSTLSEHQVVHFSCHGITSPEDPSKSRLLFKDWKTSPLTVSDFTSLNIPCPRFAYLSACHTATSSDRTLLDESIHLASAIQLAGYPSVVGTLWQVSDYYSAQIARDVYKWMSKGGKLDTERSAEGLHRAVRRLREESCTALSGGQNPHSDPLLWAPWIHLGV